MASGRVRGLVIGAAWSALLLPRVAAAQGFTLSVMEVLDQYDRRQAAAVDALSRIEHIGSIEDALRAEGESWINAQGPDAAPHRRLVAATFALEAARIAMDEEWLIGARLVEWACAELRKQATPLPAERLWHRAALALIEGTYDFEFLTYARYVARQGATGHLGHAKARVPGDPSLVMADAFLATDWHILTPFNNLWDGQASLRPGETVDRLRDALTVPSLAAEAHVRLGLLDLMANDFETAAAHLDAADTSPDPDIQYLSALFRGWAYARQGRTDLAVPAYRRALDARPNAQTAALALGAALYSTGHREEASRLVERTLEANNTPDAFDPWLLYGYGDFRRWPTLIAELREAIR